MLTLTITLTVTLTLILTLTQLLTLTNPKYKLYVPLCSPLYRDNNEQYKSIVWLTLTLILTLNCYYAFPMSASKLHSSLIRPVPDE